MKSKRKRPAKKVDFKILIFILKLSNYSINNILASMSISIRIRCMAHLFIFFFISASRA